MADYYSILNKTISNLGNNTPEIRAAVYGKARSAIEKQLRAMNPTPAEHAVQAQMNLLEEAITLIESENSNSGQIAAPQANVPEPVPANPAPTTVTETPAPIQSQAAPEEQPIITQPQSAPPQPQPIPVAPPAPVVETVSEPVIAPQAQVTPVQPAPVVTQPQVQPDVAAPEPTAVPQPAQGSMIEESTATKKRGISTKLIIGLLLVGLLIGAIFAAWTNKESLRDSIAGLLFGGGESTTIVGTQETDKEPVRIGQNGQDSQVSPVEGTSQEEGTTEIVVTQPEPVDTVETPEINQPATTPEVEPVQTPEAEKTDAASIGEVAYLYEEGSGGSGATRSAGGVAWEIVRESPGDSLPPEPVIIGNIQIAEKDISAKLTIKRNIDEALSASHLIELKFTFGDGFAGGSIENVARFVLKATEEARGEPLVAVPVKVSDGNFLIALNNLQQAVDVNTLLLKDGGWIDIPITYKNGKRALVTLEKGGTGGSVFTEALNDWKNR